MQKLLMNIHKYLEASYGIDAYTATDEQLLEAGNFINGNEFLPKTGRAKSIVSARWKNSLWKKAQFFLSCDTTNLYTLLIELKTPVLYSKETEHLAADITGKLPGDWFYWIEKGKKNGVHMHVLIHSKNPPPTKIHLGSRYFNLKPLRFYYDTSPLEAIIRTLTYGAKVRDGGYRGDGDSWRQTWLGEIHQVLDCERTRTLLSDSNLTKYTRHMKEVPDEISSAWEKVKEDRYKDYMRRLGYKDCV